MGTNRLEILLSMVDRNPADGQERHTLGDDMVTVLSELHLSRDRWGLLFGGALSGEETPCT